MRNPKPGEQWLNFRKQVLTFELQGVEIPAGHQQGELHVLVQAQGNRVLVCVNRNELIKLQLQIPCPPQSELEIHLDPTLTLKYYQYRRYWGEREVWKTSEPQPEETKLCYKGIFSEIRVMKSWH